MRIKLKNFRCHTDKELKFPERGLIQLNAKIGKGKTTILEGIYFALYGDVKKPYSFDTSQKTCSSELEIQTKSGPMKIVRSCRPNRLVVEFDGFQYEDDEAQAIIDKNFMNKFEFLASSYTRQKGNSSIISMTPTEQLEFIKNLAFDQESNTKIKEIIKDTLRNVETDIIKEKKNIEFASSQLMEFKEEEDKYDVKTNPLKMMTIEIFNEKLIEVERLLEQSRIEKEDKENKISEYEKKIEEQKELLSKKNRLEVEVQQCEEELNELRRNPLDSPSRIQEMEKIYQNLVETKENILLYERYLELEQEYEEAEHEYFSEQKKLLKEKMSKLRTEEEIEDLIRQQKRIVIYENAKKKIDFIVSEASKKITDLVPLNSEVELAHADFKRILEILKTKSPVRVYECPSCSNSLVMKNEVLVITNAKPSATSLGVKCTHAMIEKWITEFENFLAAYPDALDVDSLQGITDVLDEHSLEKNEICQIQEIVENKTCPPHIEMLKRNLNKIKRTLKIPNDEEDSEDSLCRQLEESSLDEIDAKIEKYKTRLEGHEQKSKEINRITDKLNLKFELLQETNKNLGIDSNIKTLQDEYKFACTKFDKMFRISQNYARTKVMVESFCEFMKYFEKVKLWEQRLEKSQEILKTLEAKNLALLTLRNLSHQAEILALDSVVKNINEHAKVHLDQIFSTDPMMIKVELFKQMKNDLKCKMNTVIQYAGNEYDSVDQLSGGERQLAEICFLLATNSMINSPLLMIDEGINNLDQSKNDEILEILRQYCHENGKLIIIVSHEATLGIFDKTINLSQRNDSLEERRRVANELDV